MLYTQKHCQRYLFYFFIGNIRRSAQDYYENPIDQVSVKPQPLLEAEVQRN